MVRKNRHQWFEEGSGEICKKSPSTERKIDINGRTETSLLQVGGR